MRENKRIVLDAKKRKMNIKQVIAGFRQSLKTNKQLRQSVTLMLWNFLSMPLGLVSNIVITRYMGPQAYGDYQYIQRVFDLFFILLGFGLMQSVNRAVLLSKDEKTTSEYYGSGIICLLFNWIVISIVLYATTFISPNYKEKGIFDLMLCVIPFSLIFYTNKYFEQVLPSSNKIAELIIQRYIPRIGLFVIALFIYLVVMKVDIGISPIVVVWTLFWSTQIIVYLYVFKRIKPSFSNVKQRIKSILHLNKEYGWPIYIGNLFSTAFAALMPIFLSYFGDDNKGVGFYALSLTLSQPLSFIPVVVATSHYKAFADYKSLPRKLMTSTIMVSLGAMACLWILVTPFINFFYTPEFRPVIWLTFVSSIGTILYGFSDFFSRYLMAQGQGKSLRNSSFIVGFSTLALSVGLIPWIHEFGASIAHAGAGIVYLFIIVYYYRKRVRENLQTISTNEEK